MAALAALAVPSCAADSTAKAITPKTRGLNARVTITANSLDMDELAKALSGQTGLHVEASPQIKNRKVTARLQEMRFGDVLNGLRDLFGYGYRHEEKSGKYVITEGRYRQRLEDAKGDAFREFHARLDAYRSGLAQDRELNQPANVLERYLVRMSPAQYEAFIKQRRYEVPYFRLSPADQDVVRQEFSRVKIGRKGQPPRSITEDELKKSVLRLRIAGQAPDFRLMGGYSAEGFTNAEHELLPSEARISTLHATGIRLDLVRVLPNGERGMRASKYDPLQQDSSTGAASTSTPSYRNSPALLRVISVKFPASRYVWDYTGDPNSPLSPTDDVFQAIGQQAGLNFIADSFLRRPIVPPSIRSEPLGDALDRVTDYLDYTWQPSRVKGLYLFRNPRWVTQESREISAKSARRWLRYWKQRSALLPQKPVELDEIASLAASLTNDELKEMGIFVPLATSMERGAAPFVLYAALSSEGRKKIASMEGIGWKTLTPKQRQAFLNRTPGDVRKEITRQFNQNRETKLRILTEPSQFRSESMWGGEWVPFSFVSTQVSSRMASFEEAGPRIQDLK
jgi:hypothetical protein